MNRKKLSAGFTLIELLVVIAIIGVLSTIVLSSVNQARGRARFATTYSQLDQIAKAARMHYLETQVWAPDTFPAVAPTFVPTYISSWPSPPCSGWTYDWENWDWPGLTVRITVRNSNQGGTGANGVYYYCLESSVPTCDIGGPVGGVDIKTVANKSISC